MLAGVLGLAGLALFVDRVVLGTGVTNPVESSADVVTQGPDPASLLIDHGPASAGSAKPVVTVTLADRLRRAVDGREAAGTTERDAFAVPSGWVPVAALPEPAPDTRVNHDAFIGGHRLEAVLLTGARRCAVVNGRTVYIGGQIDGYRLIGVRERSAVFEHDRSRVRLQIAGGAPAE